MFKLFGKKKPEADRETGPAPKGRNPEAAALAAQFGPEEFDILAVTGARGFGGERLPDTEYWTATLPLTAWREGDGPIHREDVCLVALADDTLLEYLRRRAPQDSVIQARVRQGLEDDRFLLVGLPTPMMDPELKAILNEQVKEVSTWIDGLGTFVLNRSVNWFQADVEWLDQSIQLTFDRDADQAGCIRTARALMADQAGWDGRVRAFASGELLSLINEAQEDAEGDAEAAPAPVTEEQFMERMELESIQVCEEGRFEFWFSDGDLFLDRAVRVSGSLTGGPDGARMEE